MNPLDLFPPDYFAARQRFRDEAQARGATLTAYPVGEAGHTIDTARFGPIDASGLLILSSGLHGVEGPFGSAVQMGFMRATLPRIPTSLGVLLLHALNPIAFDRRRRFNEDNVDLNRNFLDPDDFPKLREESLTSLYRTLDGYLNPPSPPRSFDAFPFYATWLLMRYGRERLRQSLPVGQYAFPKGLFFGGERRCESTRLIMSHIDEWVGPAKRILHLDWHTGLGEWAGYKLLCTLDRSDPRSARARAVFGDALETPDGKTAYRSRGDMGEWLMRHGSDREYLCLCAEFGTYPNSYTLQKLRKENRAEHFCAANDPIRLQAKVELSEAFVPASLEWRRQVIDHSLEIVQRGLTFWAS